MHQGRMFSSQSRYTPVHGVSGWNAMRPSRTTSIAGLASSPMSQNHWSEISGSTRRPERWECGTSCT